MNNTAKVAKVAKVSTNEKTVENTPQNENLVIMAVCNNAEIDFPISTPDDFIYSKAYLLKKRFEELKKMEKKGTNAKVSLKGESKNAKAFIETLENQIDLGYRAKWKYVIQIAGISQAYSFNLRKIPHIKELYEKWSELPELEILEKIETKELELGISKVC